MNGFDVEGFSQHCADFDRISPLDHWKTGMLVKAKRHVSAAAGEGEDGEVHDHTYITNLHINVCLLLG